MNRATAWTGCFVVHASIGCTVACNAPDSQGCKELAPTWKSIRMSITSVEMEVPSAHSDSISRCTVQQHQVGPENGVHDHLCGIGGLQEENNEGADLR